MASESKSKQSAKSSSYSPYGLPLGMPLGYPFARGWPGVSFMNPFFRVRAYGPFGMLYSAETMQKQQIGMLKAQAEHFENMAKDIRAYVADIEKR